MARKEFAFAAALVLFGAATGFAADLPPRSYVQAPVVSPVYNWTGIYLGVNAGYAFGKQDPLSLFSDEFDRFEYTANGAMVGGTLGAQIQSGHVVMGLEGDFDWANINGSGSGSVVRFGANLGTATLLSKVSSISTLRTRIGYAQDNWLFYGTIGVALTNDQSTIVSSTFVCNAGTVPCSSKSEWHAGLAAGAGVEYGLTPNLSTKVEYLWVGAGAVNTLKENIVRVGLNWRFGA